MIEAPFLTFLVIALAILTAVLVVYIWRLRGERTIVDDLPDGLLMVDRAGRITQANPAVNRIFGKEKEAIIGQSVIEALPAIEPLLLDVPIEEPARIEVVLGENGQAKSYQVRVTVSQNQEGESLGWLVTLTDISGPKQVEEELLHQKQRIERLLAVARATTEQPTVEETLQNALNVTAALTSAEYSSLLLLDKEGVVTNGILAHGRMDPSQENIVRRVLDRGLAGWVYENKKSALVDDTLLDERWLPPPKDSYVARSALVVPILNQQTVLGILTLIHSLPHHFQQEDAFLIETAGEQMALAVRNAQLYDEQRSLAARQTTLYEVLRTAGSHLEPIQVATEAAEVIAQLTGWSAIAVLAPDGYETDLIVNAATGFLREWVGKKASTEDGATGTAFRLGEKQYLAEIGEEDKSEFWPESTAAQLAVPLNRGENVLGVLEVQSESPYPFTALDIQLADSLADALSLALVNARYHGAMRKHAADLNALYAVNRMIGRSMDLDEMLSKSLYSALTSLGFAFGLIGLVDPVTEQLMLVSKRNVPVELLPQFEYGNLEDSFAGYVYRQDRGIVISDLERDSGELRQLREDMPEFVGLLNQMSIRSIVGVPLDHQRRSLGVLCMFSRKVHQFASNDLALQVTIGQQIGMAVSHSRLFSVVSEERSLLQALIDSSRDGIIMLGANRKILVANQPALDYLHIEGRSEDWINRPFVEALMALRRESSPLVRTLIEEMRQNDGLNNLSNEGEFELAARSIRWQNLPVWSENTFLGRLLVLYDVTDEKVLNQVREDLVHTMVHDLRNPLTNIFGSLEFLGEEVGPKLSNDYRQVLEIARNNATQMVQMVASILEISRLESGQMPLDQKPISLPSMIGNVIRKQSALANNKQIRVEMEMADDLPLAWADVKLFERVLQNLIDNAIRFTPQNGIIHVSACIEREETKWLRVSVSDTGPGVPLEVKDRIFQKFTTARHEESGTGLGLAFCKMVVEAHGGQIWTENNAEQGAVFHFTLPPLPSSDSKKS